MGGRRNNKEKEYHNYGRHLVPNKADAATPTYDTPAPLQSSLAVLSLSLQPALSVSVSLSLSSMPLSIWQGRARRAQRDGGKYDLYLKFDRLRKEDNRAPS